MALCAKNKVRFIDGTLPELANGDPNKPLWVMAKSMVVTWIVNLLEKDLQPNIACIEITRVFWEDLRQRFAQGNETRIYQLKSVIYASRQEGRPAAEYYGSLKELWEKTARREPTSLHTRSTCYELNGHLTNLDSQRSSSGWDNQLKVGSSKGSKRTYGKKQHGSYGKRLESVFNQANAIQTANQSFPTLLFFKGQIQCLLSLAKPDEEGEI
ncbi:hypothetical protein CRG98_009504 [Punica granatum]|uniref:Uncharacterized protein n=1 Tax=Punica granatum TaxID=22663 RepID=A0A2I0KNH5_PUNGR|nr:hypothetical protein CRG98_009504 [Punica granatum]